MTTAAPTTAPPHRRPVGRRSYADALVRFLATSAALGLLLMLGLLVAVLAMAAVPAAREFGLGFITDSHWEKAGAAIDAAGKPIYDEYGEIVTTGKPRYGALAMVWGTAASSALALVLAVPLSLGAAIFLVRIAPRRLSGPVAFCIEFLAAIPSLAYGVWGVAVLSPLLRRTIEGPLFDRFGHMPSLAWLFTRPGPSGGRIPLTPTGADLLCAGVILAVMIIPIITSLARDILASVPPAQVEGTTALGATWWQSSVEMLRFARSALFGAIMLGLARAAGETIAVTLVIGNVVQILPSPLAPAQTMSSMLANQFGESGSDPLLNGALCYLALLLLAMSLTFNVVARYLVVGNAARTAGAH